ncbi:MAG: alkaline phosphatase family protein [Gemmatimonadetes bacterium]|nr:alkaline phosphatase family protein [Gemmatimonadota bacterium]
MRDRRVTLFIMDGARPDVFEHLASRGDLPNISRYVLERGGAVPATTVFPSTTGVAYLPFLTGCYPGTCDVPGIRWLDRSRYHGRWIRDRRHVRNYCGPQGALLNSDLAPEVKTVFDLEPDSVALCTPFTRGLAPGRHVGRVSRLVWGGLAHYTGAYQLVDRWVGRALPAVARRRHRLTFVVLPGIDGTTHFFDPWHPEVFAAFRQVDDMVGRYAQAGGLDGDHLLLLVSDHGMSRVDWHADITLAMERRGIPVLRHPALWRSNPVAAVMVSGNGSAQVYLRPGVIRDDRWSLDAIEAGDVPLIPSDLVDFLLAIDGVALVAGTVGNDVVVRSRDGRARLTPLDASRIRYVPETADVLHLSPRALTFSGEQWLAHSLDRPYPDAATQLMQLFRSPRTGELAVVAEPGADLRLEWEIPEHRSGHGSLTYDHMRCLLAADRPLAGPMRTVDVFPLVVEHLGYEVPAGIDGVSPRFLSDAREVA